MVSLLNKITKSTIRFVGKLFWLPFAWVVFNFRFIVNYFKGDDCMSALAINWATLIQGGHKTFSEVPRKLKSQVAEVLISLGCEDLVDPEYRPKEPVVTLPEKI